MSLNETSLLFSMILVLSSSVNMTLLAPSLSVTVSCQHAGSDCLGRAAGFALPGPRTDCSGRLRIRNKR